MILAAGRLWVPALCTAKVFVLCVLAGGGLGCAEHVPYTTDADTGSTHAFISIERSQNGDTERAEALAGFAQMPATVDTSAVLSLVGWGLDLPPPGQCAVRTGERDPNMPLSPIDHVELLDAGEVTVQTMGTRATLAPRAFPTVTNLISGVVYTTRDRSSAALPAGMRYLVRTSGGFGMQALSLSGQAPKLLTGVTVDGQALNAVGELPINHAWEVRWNLGNPGDWLVVEASDLRTGGGVWCTYRDEDGRALLRAGTVATRGNGRLCLHRVRSQPFDAPGINRGELRFDFEISVPVTFVD